MIASLIVTGFLTYFENYRMQNKNNLILIVNKYVI